MHHTYFPAQHRRRDPPNSGPQEDLPPVAQTFRQDLSAGPHHNHVFHLPGTLLQVQSFMLVAKRLKFFKIS